MTGLALSNDDDFDLNRIFHRCVESCNEAIMITDRDGRMKYVNPAWTRIYGYEQNEVIGKNPRILHSGLQDSVFYHRMWSSILDQRVAHWKGEIVNRAKNGNLVHVILMVTPIKDSDSRINGYMGIALDVSEQKKLEGIVSHHDRLASMGLMVSGLSHEISNPVAIIRGRAEMLLKKCDHDAHSKKGLEIIINQTDRVGDLLKKLCRFGRRPKTVVKWSPIRIRAVIEDTILLTSELINGKDVKMTIDFSHEIMVKADENYLQQIFINLLINAVQAIQEAKKNGRVNDHCITLTSNVAVFRGQTFHAISVSDTGVGIFPDDMDKVFEFFFTTKVSGEGTGLGLAIAAKLANELNGFITVDSERNRGTTFTVYLPAWLEEGEVN
jgi:PAS domain S-box-containing protein